MQTPHDNIAPSYLSEEEFSPFLNGIAGFVRDPKVGLFGPDSVFWEVNRHTLVYFLGAVQSVQMQLLGDDGDGLRRAAEYLLKPLLRPPGAG